MSIVAGPRVSRFPSLSISIYFYLSLPIHPPIYLTSSFFGAQSSASLRTKLSLAHPGLPLIPEAAKVAGIAGDHLPVAALGVSRLDWEKVTVPKRKKCQKLLGIRRMPASEPASFWSDEAIYVSGFPLSISPIPLILPILGGLRKTDRLLSVECPCLLDETQCETSNLIDSADGCPKGSSNLDATKMSTMIADLVGGFNPSEKYERQLG